MIECTMTRAARLAVVSAVAVAVIAIAGVHLLARPAASAVAPTTTTTHLAKTTQEFVIFTGSPPIDTAENAALVVVARSGLRIVAVGRLEAPVSRPPLIVTTTVGVLAIVDAPTSCADLPAIARAIHMIGTKDPAAPDHIEFGRIAGVMMLTADSEVWAAVGANPC